MDFNWPEIEAKWIKRWEAEKAFEANPNPKKPKFLVTFPYPYMNAYPHIGHFYTIMRVETMARYQRLRGKNVLFPQAFHCTGSPIENAARRIAEKEEHQWEIMRQMGFSDTEIQEFARPEKWIEFFPKETKKDYQAMGLSIDWRRSFITTELNPHYDRFIRWQFRKLKEKNLIKKGSHPVVWCPKENTPLPDHSRAEGEGETPQEFVILKFPLSSEPNLVLVAATLRPETVFGQTNLWVRPDASYEMAEVTPPQVPNAPAQKPESWVCAPSFLAKLRDQGWSVRQTGSRAGKDMVGKSVVAPARKEPILVLPASFVSLEKGTGIVTSVPSDAPDDYIALRDLQKHPDRITEFGMNANALLAIKPIAIIDSGELGDLAAVKVVEDWKIKDQHQRERLEEAKKLVYKKGFYEGKMGAACGEFAGLPVQSAKDRIKRNLLEQNTAHLFFELTGKVVCRCLTPAVVKVVHDQWFIDYGDPAWKDEVKQAFAKMNLYPPEVRAQFEYVIDWLGPWACSREFGLGTRLPWDEKWVIESLSDSTIYMAYYTIAHILETVPIDNVDDALFDYVLLDRSEAPIKTDPDAAKRMRDEFEYFYPVDFRNSGKDLVQNHLAFFVFNHVAVFPPEKWPRGIGVNGWVTVGGEKMSKSKGNFLILREAREKFGVDASRLTILSGGEGLDDANFDPAMAQSLPGKLEYWIEQSAQRYASAKGTDDRSIDAWFESRINSIIFDATQLMENANYRSAAQAVFFEFNNAFKWYYRRAGDFVNQKLVRWAIETQSVMFSPFGPVSAEELWERLGKKGLVCQQAWPVPSAKGVDAQAMLNEQFMDRVLSDISAIQNVTKIEKPSRVVLVTAPAWKKTALSRANLQAGGRTDVGILIREWMNDVSLKTHSAELPKFAQSVLKETQKGLPSAPENEHAFLVESKPFFESQLGCPVEIENGESSKNPKAGFAFPGKPAIVLEK